MHDITQGQVASVDEEVGPPDIGGRTVLQSIFRDAEFKMDSVKGNEERLEELGQLRVSGMSRDDRSQSMRSVSLRESDEVLVVDAALFAMYVFSDDPLVVDLIIQLRR